MGNKKISLFILLFSRTARSIAAGMLAIEFPFLILRTLSYTPLILGGIFSVGTLATAILGFLFGLTTDVWGRKRTLFVVTMLLPVSCFLLLLPSYLPILYVAAALGGFSATGSLAGGGIGGAAQPIQNTLLADITKPSERTFYFSLFPFLNGLAAAAGALMVRYLSTPSVFLFAGIISLIGALSILPLTSTNIKGNISKLQGKITIGKFTLTGLLNGFSQGLIAPFFIPFFILFYHVSRSEMSFYSFVSGTIAAAVLLLAPIADKKFGFVQSITWTRGASIVLLLLLPLIHFLPLALFIYFATPALRILAVPIQQNAITSLVSKEERGRALGINQVVRLGGSSLAIALTGSLFSGPFIAIPFYLYAATTGINIYLYKIFFGKKK